MGSGNGADATSTALLGKAGLRQAGLRQVGLGEYRQALGLAFAMVCGAGIILAVTDPIAGAGDSGQFFRAALSCQDGLPSRGAQVRAANPADARQSLADVYPGCTVERIDRRGYF